MIFKIYSRIFRNTEYRKIFNNTWRLIIQIATVITVLTITPLIKPTSCQEIIVWTKPPKNFINCKVKNNMIFYKDLLGSDMIKKFWKEETKCNQNKIFRRRKKIFKIIIIINKINNNNKKLKIQIYNININYNNNNYFAISNASNITNLSSFFVTQINNYYASIVFTNFNTIIKGIRSCL